MRILKKSEKGFTLIDLLITVAILGVLAAIVIPNVGRFIGRGKTEAAATERTNVQSMVSSMMTDQHFQLLPGANITDRDSEAEATTDMSTFPDADPDGAHLYHYGGNESVNYIATQNTTYKYWIDTNGTVYQVK
jgi:prepilin-type N-terminal cleavage/methylation domain-containing protein